MLTLPLLPVWPLGSLSAPSCPRKMKRDKIKQAIKLRTSGGVVIE
jgi:hypothetical protein